MGWPITPFIVSYPRSGSTLLRLILDSHSDLAIPPETHMCPLFSKPYAREKITPIVREDILSTVTNSPRWGDFGIDRKDFAKALQSVADGEPVSKAFAFFWEFYASLRGKSRWGDKTPSHMLCVGSIASIFPAARFIHIVRDPRDVICSVKALRFSQDRTAVDIAADWVRRIESFDRQADLLEGKVMTVRYEDLVSDTENVTRAVSLFCTLAFQKEQLLYFVNAAQRLAELGDLRKPAGVAKSEERREIHRLTSHPPTTARIGRWRNELSVQDIGAVQKIIGKHLGRFGYSDLSRS